MASKKAPAKKVTAKKVAAVKEVAPKKIAKIRDMYSKSWIIDNAVEILDGESVRLTLRALHYRLVSRGMTNDIQHYKRVINAMTDARWDDVIAFDTFDDHEREVIGITDYRETTVDDKIERAEQQIQAWATSYSKNKWENQPIHPEVWIEKKALQGFFEDPCNANDVALCPCKGYPSLTFLYEAYERFTRAINDSPIDKDIVILYFGDYDCSGEDIPRSIQVNLERMGITVEVRRIALMEDQVTAWKLPPAPTKSTDSRAANWDGMGQVELDAVDTRRLQALCNDAIAECFNTDLYEDLLEQQRSERAEFKQRLKDNFNNLLD